MLSNAFSKSIKLAYWGAFHSLLCSKMGENVIRAWASRAKTCLFLPGVFVHCFSQSCMNDLAEDLASYGEQSNTSPVVTVTQIALFGQSSTLHELFPSPISLWICTSKGVVSQFLQPWAFLLSLHLLHMPFRTSSLWWQLSPLPW